MGGCLKSRRTTVAGCCPGCDPARTLCGPADFQTAQNRSHASCTRGLKSGFSSLGIRSDISTKETWPSSARTLRCWSEVGFERAGSDLAGMRAHPRHVPPATSKSAAGSKAMVVVILDRTAQLATDLGRAARPVISRHEKIRTKATADGRLTKNITTRLARTYRCTRTPRSRARSMLSVTRWRCPFWADCTTNISERKFPTWTAGAGEPAATITATCRRTKSAASAGSRSY